MRLKLCRCGGIITIYRKDASKLRQRLCENCLPYQSRREYQQAYGISKILKEVRG
jgi:hypothetical protein